MSVERVGISIEHDLLMEYDTLIRTKGYMSRSESIRDLIREAIVKSSVESARGDVFGTLTIVYDHDVGNVTERLLHLQHHHSKEIVSTLHIHLDEHNCLEVLILRGMAEDVRSLADSIKALKGVKYGELVLIPAITR